jgi:hypothetical protein
MIGTDLTIIDDEHLAKAMYVCDIEIANIQGKLEAWRDYRISISQELLRRLDVKKSLSKKEEQERKV